jgi:hypothetical protein
MAKVKTAPKKSKGAEILGALHVTEATIAPEMVDEYVALTKKVAKAQEKLKPYLDKISEMEKEFSVAVDESVGPAEEFTLEGVEFNIDYTSKGNARDITDKATAFKLLEKVKKGLALELAKVGLGDLDKYLTPEQVAKVTVTEARNARRKKIVEKV